MKKILVILHANTIAQHVMDHSIDISKKCAATLEFIFIHSDLDFAEYNYSFPNDLSLTRNNITGKTTQEEDAELLQSNKRLVEDICKTAEINYIIHTSLTLNLGHLIELSAFSDLIITDATEESLQQYHIIDLLTGAHCPVYLVSKTAQKIEHIVLTYDGSFSSIHAIKSYANLFPGMMQLPSTLVYITHDHSDEFPREKNIKSWLPEHFKNVDFKIIHGKVANELISFVKNIPGSLTIMGSFGRSSISRLFHKSLANAVIAEGCSTLFITHR